jgi:hypothetical protein
MIAIRMNKIAKLIIFIFFFIGGTFDVDAQILAIHGMVPAKTNQAPGTLLQTVNINFEANGGGTSQLNWNTWEEHISDNMVLSNSSGTGTSFKLIDLGGEWDREVPGTYAANADWPQNVLERNVYTFNTPIGKTLRFTNLDSSKKYKLKFATIQNYDSNPVENLTDITVEGVTQRNGLVAANVLYTVEFTVNNPSGGVINFKIWPASEATYALICAMKLEEYSL